jgi:NAD(P)-dependent dehydrogenase (short-subunit alcohol dehydrogenase family)
MTATHPDLAGQRVVITGGASGIGLATAERFVSEGSSVAILDRDSGGLQAARTALPGLGALVAADVADRDSVERAFEQIDRELGGVDILVANAGISIRHRFLDITLEEWRQVLAVNLDGVFNCAQLAARRMESEGGVILMTASTNGVVGHPFYADYNVSKAGVILLARAASPGERGLPRLRDDSDAAGRVHARDAGRDGREDPPRPPRPAG